MIDSRLVKICLIALATLLVSCMEDVRSEWNNPSDPDSKAWIPHRLTVLDVYSFPTDSEFAAPGDTIGLRPGFGPDANSAPHTVAWRARNLRTGAIVAIRSDAQGSSAVALDTGTWIVRVDDASSSSAIYLPDSIVVVVGTGNKPIATSRSDTVIYCHLPLGEKDTIGLFAVDPRDRWLSYWHVMDGMLHDGRVVALSGLTAYGTYTIEWGISNPLGLHDNSSFTVTLRPDTILHRGISYRVAPFGTQVWMLDNLRHDTANGLGSWCYDNKPENCARYGRLYDWATATAGHVGKDTPNVQDQPLRGLCPQGWHIPTFVDMMTLKAWLKRPDVLYVPDELVGRAMESESFWNPFWPDSRYRGASGFDLLPGGFYDAPNQQFRHLGAHGDFWTSQHWNSDSARIMAVFENNFFAATDTTDERHSQAGGLLYIDVSQKFGMPVRCLQN